MEKRITLTPTHTMHVRDLMKSYLSANIESLIKNHGEISVGGERRTARQLVYEGETLSLLIPETSKPYPMSVDCSLSLIYRDEDIAIVYKPKGITSMPTRGHDSLNLLAGLNHLLGEGVYRVVTRLDKDTEGLVLIALHTLAHSTLSSSTIDKRYIARLSGILPSPITVDAPIDRVPDSIVRTVSTLGKRAVTEYTPISYVDGDTIAEIRLYTGRTHQIRVHSAHIGHPVRGDTLYSSESGEYNCGQILYCASLSFTHPLTNAPITYDVREDIVNLLTNPSPIYVE